MLSMNTLQRNALDVYLHAVQFTVLSPLCRSFFPFFPSLLDAGHLFLRSRAARFLNYLFLLSLGSHQYEVLYFVFLSLCFWYLLDH